MFFSNYTHSGTFADIGNWVILSDDPEICLFLFLLSSFFRTHVFIQRHYRCSTFVGFTGIFSLPISILMCFISSNSTVNSSEI